MALTLPASIRNSYVLYGDYDTKAQELTFFGHSLVDLELLLRECSNRGISLTEVIGAVRAIAPR